LNLPYSDPELYLCIVIKNNRVATGRARVKGFKALLLEELSADYLTDMIIDLLFIV